MLHGQPRPNKENALYAWLNNHRSQLRKRAWANRLRIDSRQVTPGDIFVAIKGSAADGSQFIPQAVQQGAAIIVAHKDTPVPQGVDFIPVNDPALAAALLAHAVYDNPSDKLTCLAVTGTNGKTTVAYLVRSILNFANIPCGLVGTVEYDLGDTIVTADNTTPDAVRLADMMHRMTENNLKAMVMECSSHGLDQKRSAGINFRAAAFTNLTGDHLDYHKTPQQYLQAKSILFRDLAPDALAVLNAEDPASSSLVDICPAKMAYYAVDTPADIFATVQASDLAGSSFSLNIDGRSFPTHTPMPGRHNISNCLAAAALAHAAGADPQTIADAIRRFPGVPGRLQAVPNEHNLTVLVDYAHTDDALERVLIALKKLKPNKIILVFGCGGQRDRSKRPRMARIAQQYADTIFVTNDNPRNEPQDQIFADIHEGFDTAAPASIEQIRDRRLAITAAVNLAEPSDVVLIAGKGHETYQLIAGQRLDFDDRQVARHALQQKKQQTNIIKMNL